jgi:hypothetical protein
MTLAQPAYPTLHFSSTNTSFPQIRMLLLKIFCFSNFKPLLGVITKLSVEILTVLQGPTQMPLLLQAFFDA